MPERRPALMERITSRTNPLLTHIRRLAASGSYRRQCGEYLGDSPKLLQEALLWKAELVCVVLRYNNSNNIVE